MNMKKFLSTLLALVMLVMTVPAFDLVALAAPKHYIEVDITNQIVTVYENGNRTESGIVHQMICSTGKNGATPRGTFTMPSKRYSSERTEWHHLFGAWGRYCSRITGNILFHSVPYSSKSLSSQSKTGLKALGTPASAGCIRLRDADAYWIAMNCPAGTKVKIYKSGKKNNTLRALLLKSSFDDGNMSYDEFLGRDTASTLKKGSTGDKVVQLQKRLIGLGYLFDDADGNFGTNTHNAVVCFQRIAGLTQNGKVTTSVWKKLFASDAPEAPLMTGSSGSKVEKLQQALTTLKMYTGAAHGSYDAATAAAVKKYQQTFGLTANGEAGSSVQSAILKKAAEVKEKFGDSNYDLVETTTKVKKAKVKVSSRLNLRQKASTSSKTLVKLSNGKIVTVLSKGKTWSKVTYGKYTGYVKSQYLKFYNETVTTLGYESVPEPTPTPVPTPTPDPNAPVLPTPAPVAVRETLREGSTGGGVRNLQQALKELKLYDGEVTGSYDAATAAAVRTFQKGSGLSQDGKATTSLQTAVFKKAAEVKETFEGSDYEPVMESVKVKKAKVKVSSRLNLRQKASTSSKVLTKLSNGKVVTVDSKGKTWSKVTYGKYTGYVKSQYLKFYNETASRLVYEPVAAPTVTPEPTMPVLEPEATVTPAPTVTPVFDGQDIRDSFVAETAPEATEAPTAEPAPTEAPVAPDVTEIFDEMESAAEDDGAAVEMPLAPGDGLINEKNPSGMIEPEATEAPEKVYAVVRRDAAALYDRPEEKEENFVAEVEKDAFFEVVHTDRDWTQVVYEDENCWIRTEDVKITEKQPKPTPVPAADAEMKLVEESTESMEALATEPEATAEPAATEPEATAEPIVTEPEATAEPAANEAEPEETEPIEEMIESEEAA